MTARNSVSEIVRSSLLLLGAISQEETPSAAEANDAVARLNDLLDIMSIERSMLFTLKRLEFSLGSAAAYTIGPGGDWSTDYRPAKIEECYCQITTTNPTAEIPVQVYNAQQWAGITVKGTTTTIPKAIYCDNNWPLATINVFPVPQSVNKLILWVWSQINGTVEIDDVLSLPPGYNIAIIFNLAEMLGPFYGKELSDDNKRLASKYKTLVARKNLPVRYSGCDAAVLSTPRIFNWLTGEPR